MASDQTLRVIITALGRASEPIRRINARLAAMTSPLRRISSGIGEIAEQTRSATSASTPASALEKVRHPRRGTTRAGGPAGDAGRRGKSRGPGGDRQVGGGVRGKPGYSLGEDGHRDRAACRLELCRWPGQCWRGAARQGFWNGPIKNINEAAHGKAKDVQQIFARMGLSNSPKHLASTTDALRAVSEETKHLVDRRTDPGRDRHGAGASVRAVRSGYPGACRYFWKASEAHWARDGRQRRRRGFSMRPGLQIAARWS